MIRRTTFKTTVAAPDGRQLEYEFYITQMPAMQLERWLFRVGKVLVGAGILDSISDGQETLSKMGAALQSDQSLMGMLSKLSGIDDVAAWKLLEELTACAEIVVGGNIYKLDEQTINAHLDLPALVRVQAECAKLNFGFFTSAMPLGSDVSPAPKASADMSKRKQRISVRSLAKS